MLNSSKSCQILCKVSSLVDCITGKVLLNCDRTDTEKTTIRGYLAMVMENYLKTCAPKLGTTNPAGVAGILFDKTRTKVLLEKRGDGEIGWIASWGCKIWRNSDDLFAT